MCDMAYGSNAVQLTIDSYLSRNIENENENGNENENENENENGNGNVNGNENVKRSDKNGSREKKIENSEEEEIINSTKLFKEKRSAAYERWLDVPDTPYKRVNNYKFIIFFL